MTCNFKDFICVRFVLFVANCFLSFFRVIIGPFLPCRCLRWVWSIISYCFSPVKCVFNHICSFLFWIWMSFIVGPTINTIISVVKSCLYWGYQAVRKCFVYLVTLIFFDLYKLALIAIAKCKDMGISEKIYDWVVGTVSNILNKLFDYFSGNQDVKRFLAKVITGVRDFILQTVTGSVSGVTDKITNSLFFWRKESNADEKVSAEDHGDAVVENVAEVSADRNLLNALPDNTQESTVKAAVEEPESVQAKLKSLLKQKSSRNSPTKKTL